jgi:DNA repair protein RecN (Recombination protein N)
VPLVLEEIRIQGLGVIEDAVLPLSPGLTVLTGETGAGKTMVVQGLALLFGGRADSGRVRPGAERALVEGRLVLPADHPGTLRALEAGAVVEDDVVLVARSVSADGRSRAHLGGRSVPVAVLAELGEDVLALHGQSDQQRLLQPTRQREALDRFAGAEVLDRRESFAQGWAELRALRGTLRTLRDEVGERLREAELLRLGLAEVAAVAPVPAEDVAVRAEAERLSHADLLRTAAGTALGAVAGDDSGEPGDALQALAAARRALDAVAEHDPELVALAARLQGVALDAADLGHDLAAYLASVEADPARLAVVQERLAALTGLVRRHGAEGVDGVLAWADEAGQRLLALDGADDRISALAAQEAELVARLGTLAGELTQARTAAAARFGAAVTTELVQLAMPHAQVTAEVRQRDDVDGLLVGDQVLQAGPHGVDEVEVLLVPHPGAPARPLAKGASGGELSRVMLAVEVVFAGSDPVPVMVFDEVDAGVGGAAAVEVGRRLARLAASHQVLVVTHLPQVAAFADQHLHVSKHSTDGALTRGGVTVLDADGRVAELSRMMAGLDSGLARAHAEELLVAASRARSEPGGS